MQAPPNLDDLDDDMVADLVRTYNFGGGDEEGGEDGAPRKTRKQVGRTVWIATTCIGPACRSARGAGDG